MTKAELWKAIEDYRCAGGRVEHAVLKEKLDAMLDDLLNTPQKTEPPPVIWQSWSDKYGYGYWDTKDEALLNSAEDFEPVPRYKRQCMEELRAESHNAEVSGAGTVSAGLPG